MPHINLLPPHVADLIAAGEVVERPASVVKEMVENAFDAGASLVTVEIRDGGATMIRITDNGCGMAPEDAGIAFLRHATSKLKDEYGLEAIRTMGFRGEALAAIASVSRIEMTTRRPEDTLGTKMTLEAGDIQDMEETGCPAGTSICVRDLFYNTPARRKFLKSDRSEGAACAQAALRCALGRPDISVRFIRDGREEFYTPGDGKAESCCYALFGRELTASFLPVVSADDGIGLQGFVSSPASGRGNRSTQYFYVNGRYIKSAQLQTALEQAYKNSLLTGRYPACVLYLTVRPEAVDVNVHPAKTEVKFSEERRVFSLVYQAVFEALRQEDRLSAPAVQEEEQAAAPAVSALPDITKAETYSAERSDDRQVSARKQTMLDHRETVRASWQPVARETEAPVQQSLFAAPVSEYRTEKQSDDRADQKDEALAPVNHRLLGEAFKTYLLVEQGEKLILIDKHAAHERMNFDRLKARQQPAAAQELLLPQPLRLNGEDLALLEEHGELFREFGFRIERFGQETVILRAVPQDILPEDALPAVEEILEHLRAGGNPDPAAARDEILHTVACKAAVKAGWNTSRQEQERIADEVLSGRVRYCPHGRPVSIVMTREELDRLFLRIVS